MAKRNLFLTMSKIRVAIIKGGPSHEHNFSIKTAEEVFKKIPKHYCVHDVFIDKNCGWHLDGKFAHPEKVARTVDVVFNATHGQFGEDGELQQILDSFGIPYTGSGATASLQGMNKFLAKNAFKNAGLSTPNFVVVDSSEDFKEAAVKVCKKVGTTVVVKPLSSGSSVGVVVVNGIKDLIKALEWVSGFSKKILVEEYIKGVEATCGVIENFRKQKYYALMPAEVVPRDGAKFLDYGTKLDGGAMEKIPAESFSPELKKKIEDAAVKAHKAIGAKHYSRTDFIITPRGKIYVLEINTLPGLGEKDVFTKSLESVGAKYSDFLDHLIKLALKN